MENIEELKQRLKSYKKKEIKFNEPHFTHQLILREGNKEEVIKNLLNPTNLVYFEQRKGKYGDTIYCLYFKISNTRTMKIPVILNPKKKKCLYILTYIMRYRPWQKKLKIKKRR